MEENPQVGGVSGFLGLYFEKRDEEKFANFKSARIRKDEEEKELVNIQIIKLFQKILFF